MIKIIFVTIIATIIFAIYLLYKHSLSYFKRKNIPYLEPSFPFGNIQLSFFRKYGQDLAEFYHIFKKRGEKIAGLYIFNKHVLVPIHPEVIKEMLTKNFNDFNTRGMYCNEEKEFLTAHLAALSGPGWKTLRSKLTPAFSGSKIKSMFQIMLEKGSILERKLEELESSSSCFETKDLCSKLTMDMFCSIFLGLTCDSMNNPNENFSYYYKKICQPNYLDAVRMSLTMIIPEIVEMFNMKFVRKDVTDFIVDSIKNIVEYREKNPVERQDFMNLLLRLKNLKDLEDGKTSIGAEDGITLKQLISQCFVFFIADVDTSSSTISYCLFELTQNQDLQDKLREEIQTVMKNNDGNITYEGVMDMKLLDKVVCETLRKYPPVVVLNRKCVNDYVIPGTDVRVEKGTFVFVPLLGIHHDPEYYPEPDKFDPERFSEEAKAKRLPFTYLPFGEGPRICIGYRFGMMQVKLGIIFFLRNYKFTLNSKTQLPLEYRTEIVLLSHHNKIWMDMKKIKK